MMNGVNNQSINPLIAQNLEFFQESTKSANEYEVEVAHPQETEDVNTAKPSDQEFTQKRKSNALWTAEEEKRFIELKQQYPYLPWPEFAKKYFPNRTYKQCTSLWNKRLAPRLYKEGKLIDPKAEEIDPTSAQHGNTRWTQEENKRFIELKLQHPKMPWKDFAKHFPGHTRKQCTYHWHDTLERKLIRKRVSTTPDEDIDIIKHLSKRSRIALPNPAIPATFSEENPHPLMNSSPPFPQELAGIAVPSLFHALPIQKTFQDEQKEILDLSFYHYEEAVNHFQKIQLTNPLLQSAQQEAAKSFANAQLTYQVIKQRIATETNCIPILEQAESLINFCQTKTYYFETIYQHFLPYQAEQESKEWFSSQSKEFANLYFAFLKGTINEVKFRHLISLKEIDYYYKKLNSLFIRLQDILRKYSFIFSLEYNKFLDELFFSIEFQFNLLKDNQENWKSTLSSLEEILSRLQEIEVFFQSCSDPIPPSETEANILARLKNEISLQDFYAKQTALMTIQQEGKQAKDSLPVHEPSQTPSQPQEDFFSDPLFSPLSDQEY